MTTGPELVARFGSPLYVYDAAEIRARCRELRGFLPGRPAEIFYAAKANANRAILEILLAEGLGIDGVSEGEVKAALRAGFPAARISFNGNNVSDAELRAIHEAGVHVIVDSLGQLERFGRLFPGTAVGVRINPDVGDGHHDHVVTGGPQAKFGIEHALFADILATANRHRLKIDVLQQHIGSGLLDPAPMLEAADVLLRIAPAFVEAGVLDFGGGFGVPYRRGEDPLDLALLGRELGKRLDRFEASEKRRVTARFEPGRYVVATSGTLYCTVTAVKRTRTTTFVGTDSGMHHLLRPALYGSWHEVENLSNPGGPIERVSVVGQICESGDVLAKDRPLPKPREGDVLAVRNAGAYGFSMASTYNLRPRPAEVVLEDGEARLVRRRETIDDLLGRD